MHSIDTHTIVRTRRSMSEVASTLSIHTPVSRGHPTSTCNGVSVAILVKNTRAYTNSERPSNDIGAVHCILRLSCSLGIESQIVTSNNMQAVCS